jgi:hypothetical protein
MKLNGLAKLLHGDWNSDWLNIAGPGHKKGDRSLGVRFDPKAPNGFRVHSLADDDPAECRNHVKKLLQKIANGGSLAIECDTGEGAELAMQGKIARAKFRWGLGLPVKGSSVETYLSMRGIQLSLAAVTSDALRSLEECLFGLHEFPAMIARISDIVTGELVGIHRTALRDDGTGKREMPDGMSAKMILGRAKGGAVMLGDIKDGRLGIAEGIETALSAAQIFNIPVWAVLSANGMAYFPIVPDIKRLTIFADHDDPGISAAHRCAQRYAAAGIDGEIQHPSKKGSDWNNYLQEEHE